MTGPEHYREAERLLNRSRLDDIDHDTADTDRANLAAAQIHATLALAAATALAPGTLSGQNSPGEWWEAAR